MKKPFLAALGLLTLGLFAINPASAFYKEKGSSYMLPFTLKDSYQVGESVVVTDNVAGDLVAAGATVLLKSSVAQDAMIAGSNVHLLGPVGDDARLAGSTVLVADHVKDDLFAAASDFQLVKGAFVEGNALVAGEKVTIDGNIKGNAQLMGDKVTINGVIDGDVWVESRSAVVVSSSAKIKGNLSYRSSSEVEIAPGVVGGEVIFESMPWRAMEKNSTERMDWKEMKKGFFSVLSFFFLAEFTAVLFAALVLVYLFKKSVTEIVKMNHVSPAKDALKGFLLCVGAPVAIFILFVSVLGWFLGLTALVALGVLVLLGKVLSGVVLGSWIFSWIRKSKDMTMDWKVVLLGVVVLYILKLIPIVGWLVVLFIFFSTVGSMSMYKYKLVTNGKKSA